MSDTELPVAAFMLGMMIISAAFFIRALLERIVNVLAEIRDELRKSAK